MWYPRKPRPWDLSDPKLWELALESERLERIGKVMDAIGVASLILFGAGISYSVAGGQPRWSLISVLMFGVAFIGGASWIYFVHFKWLPHEGRYHEYLFDKYGKLVKPSAGEEGGDNRS